MKGVDDLDGDESRDLPGQAPMPAPTFGRLERLRLTYQYYGLGSVAYRTVTYPLRYTPLRRLLRTSVAARMERAAAVRWYKKRGWPVTIVIPSYRDAEHVRELVASLRKTTRRSRARIIVADDASGPEHLAALRAIGDIDVVEGDVNLGFAGNVNRGIRAAGSGHDIVVLNSDVRARSGWLESLQYASICGDRIGIVGGKLLYPDNRIQFAGTIRNPGAPEWFDHRFRFKNANFGPANVRQPTLAVTGACMYLTRDMLSEVGLMDEGYPMAYEDVDLCLRAWEHGFRVAYMPSAELEHLESVTRGTEVGDRERASQQRFWERWGPFFDERPVRTQSGALRIVYVTEDTGVGGGHRDIFEHLNRLRARGHEAELWTLGNPPQWFDLDVPVRTFDTYIDLVDALTPVDAIKVATWWNTAPPVWLASVTHGIPVYFVQDIETSYYPGSRQFQNQVLASYRHEFRYMTISSWNRDRLRELGLDATLIPPGIDLDTFRPLPGVERRTDMILALGRTNPLKNLPLTLAAWRGLPEPRPELWLFGSEPSVANEPGVRYIENPSDEQVNQLLNEATVFVQTSIHEGFCLPPLESMATGGAVVCTDAHGNTDFCVRDRNCLMPDPDAEAVRRAMSELLADASLRARLGEAGCATAAEYSWELRIDALETFMTEVAELPARVGPSTLASGPHAPVD